LETVFKKYASISHPPRHQRLIAPRRWRKLETDEAQLTKHVAALGGRLDVYEKILSKQKYIAGNEFSLADIFHLPYGVKVYQGGGGDLSESRPNVKRGAQCFFVK